MTLTLHNASGGASASPIFHQRLSIVLGASLLFLAACGENETAPGPGGVTVGEARALDEAAEMLDQQRLPDAVLNSETELEGLAGED